MDVRVLQVFFFFYRCTHVGIFNWAVYQIVFNGLDQKGPCWIASLMSHAHLILNANGRTGTENEKVGCILPTAVEEVKMLERRHYKTPEMIY